MTKITVFIEKDNAMLFSSRDLQQPTLIGYTYEYEMDEKAVEYWKTLNPEAGKALVREAEMQRTDLRRVIQARLDDMDTAPIT